MDLSTWILFGVVAVLGINQAVMRVERLQDDDRVYFAVQIVDLLMASGCILIGLPGFDAFPAVPVVVGLLILLHVAQNYNARAHRQREARAEERAEIEAEAARRRAAREAQEEGPG